MDNDDHTSLIIGYSLITLRRNRLYIICIKVADQFLKEKVGSLRLAFIRNIK